MSLAILLITSGTCLRASVTLAASTSDPTTPGPFGSLPGLHHSSETSGLWEFYLFLVGTS